MHRSSQLASSRSRSRDSAAKMSRRSNPRAASKCSIRVHVSEREGTSVRASLRAEHLRVCHTVQLRNVQPGALRSRAPGQHARSRGSPARAFSCRASRSSSRFAAASFSASKCDHTFCMSMCSPFRRNAVNVLSRQQRWREIGVISRSVNRSSFSSPEAKQ